MLGRLLMFQGGPGAAFKVNLMSSKPIQDLAHERKFSLKALAEQSLSERLPIKLTRSGMLGGKGCWSEASCTGTF